jgi:hypothetical protein
MIPERLLVQAGFLKDRCDAAADWHCPECGTSTSAAGRDGAECHTCLRQVLPVGQCARCTRTLPAGESVGARTCQSIAAYREKGLVAFRPAEPIWRYRATGEPEVASAESALLTRVRRGAVPADAVVQSMAMADARPLRGTAPFAAACAPAATPPRTVAPPSPSAGHGRAAELRDRPGMDAASPPARSWRSWPPVAAAPAAPTPTPARGPTPVSPPRPTLTPAPPAAPAVPIMSPSEETPRAIPTAPPLPSESGVRWWRSRRTYVFAALYVAAWIGAVTGGVTTVRTLEPGRANAVDSVQAAPVICDAYCESARNALDSLARDTIPEPTAIESQQEAQPQADSAAQIAPEILLPVPDVSGLQEGPARDRMWDAGFLVGDVQFRANRSPAGTVLATTPPAGNLLAATTAITLYISDGRALVDTSSTLRLHPVP